MDGRSRQVVAARSRWSRACVAAQVGRHVVVDGSRRRNGRVARSVVVRTVEFARGSRSRTVPSRQGRGRAGFTVAAGSGRAGFAVKPGSGCGGRCGRRGRRGGGRGAVARGSRWRQVAVAGGGAVRSSRQGRGRGGCAVRWSRAVRERGRDRRGFARGLQLRAVGGGFAVRWVRSRRRWVTAVAVVRVGESVKCFLNERGRV